MNLRNRKIKNLFLTMMLIVAMALTVAGCGSKTRGSDKEGQADGQAETEILGEGSTVIDFIVVDGEGNETRFEIHTDKENVGDALLEQELIAGEETAYGLYVKQVNGIIADYDVDQTYWAFYINGEYASSGVDTTPVQAGETYAFKLEK